jgi:hypothetical protein
LNYFKRRIGKINQHIEFKIAEKREEFVEKTEILTANTLKAESFLPAFQLTRHAASRMAQRGISRRDIELMSWIGPEIEGGYFVTEKNFQVLDRELKQLRNRARRLVGKRVVCDGDVVHTRARRAGCCAVPNAARLRGNRACDYDNHSERKA